jgi:hypothetical protein
MRETQELIEQLKTKHELKANTAVNKKWLIRATGALGTGLAAYELYSIDQQYDIRSAWISYLEDCIKNPTIPRFADPAGRPDPGFDQSISQIESAKEGLKVTTSAMYVASAANGAAGLLAHNPAVEALTMLMSTVENGLLSETAELDIRDLMKNNPCKPLNPCEETPDDPPSPTPPTPYGDYTPGPGEAGFFMTMGPREWYEPPERRQVQCKPEWNEVRLAIDMAGPRGSLGEEVYISFDASTNVTNLADLSAVTGVQNYTLEFGEFFGNATSNLSYKEIWRPDDPVNTCTITINGPAEMRIVILPNMSGPMVDGVYTLAEASVEVVGPLPVVSRPAGCDLSGRGVTGGDTGDDAILFCSFGEVDLRGGSYKNWLFSEGDDGCRLFMGPLDPSKMTPAVHHPVRR